MKGLKDQLVGLDPKFRYRGLNQTLQWCRFCICFYTGGFIIFCTRDIYRIESLFKRNHSVSYLYRPNSGDLVSALYFLLTIRSSKQKNSSHQHFFAIRSTGVCLSIKVFSNIPFWALLRINNWRFNCFSCFIWTRFRW